MESKKYHNLVLEIYQTVSEPDSWPDVLDKLKSETSAHGIILWEYRWSQGKRQLHAPFKTSNYSRSALNAYVEENHELELFDHSLYEKISIQKDGVELVNESDLYSDENIYRALPHVKKMGDYGIWHRYGGILNKDNLDKGRFSIQRSKGKGVFSNKEEVILGIILPHLAKALDISSQLDSSLSTGTALRDIINKLTIGACLLDAKGNLCERNSLFDEHAIRFGAFRVDPSGRLTMTDPRNQSRLKELLDDARNHGHFGARPRKEAIVAESSDGTRAICVEVVPCSKLNSLGSTSLSGAWVLTRDTMEPIGVNVDWLRQLFRLTNAECDLVDLICEGLTNHQIAERMDKSPATVTTQVKSILHKCQVANRTQFVRFLCNFAIPKPIAAPV